MLFVVGLVTAIFLLVSSSSVLMVVAASGWVIHPALGVIIYSALRRPFAEAASLTLIVAFLADLLASGPPGIHGLALTVVFFATVGASKRVGGRLVLATFGLVFLASVALDFAEAMLVVLFYPESHALSGFLLGALPSALASALVSLFYSGVLVIAERIWRQRAERSVVV